jgi:hypothetical protein
MRRRAWLVIAAFVATVAYGLVLLAGFDPGVQGLESGELFARSDDARAFLVADLFFPLFYGIAFPIAAWRFGRSLRDSRPPWYFIAASLALATGAAFDLAENGLLLIAVDGESTGLVDAAHAIAVPKLLAGLTGDLLALAVVARAVLTLRPHHGCGTQ